MPGLSTAVEGLLLPNSLAPSQPSTLVLQVRLKAFHRHYLNHFAAALFARAEALGLPRPSQAFLPRKTERWTVLRSPHVDKKARDQFQRVTHKRLVTIHLAQGQGGGSGGGNVELAYRLLRSLPNVGSGVEVRAKYLSSTGEGVVP